MSAQTTRARLTEIMMTTTVSVKKQMQGKKGHMNKMMQLAMVSSVSK